MDKTKVFNIDCMQGMKEFPDKHFELAIVDPPYGIEKEISVGGKESSKSTVNFHNRYKSGTLWDKKPSKEYFEELRRVSVDQIICGGNYFPDLWIEPCRGFVFWYKETPVPNFSDGEFLWTSFKRPAKFFKHRYTNILDGNNVREDIKHPTAKPVALYKWLLKNYAKEGDKILDSHLGSGSSRIAAFDMGFDFTGYELDTDYFNAQEKRFHNHKSQLKLFS
jgi:site-specific DNA-methyltransferase (adenine-specific)